MSEEVLANIDPDEIQVSSLVEEFLAAQSLKILPQAPFGDAVVQFVTKDDKHAMEHFVRESLSGQVKQMLSLEDDDEDLENAMSVFKQKLEQQFKAGDRKKPERKDYNTKPLDWDSDLDGHWEDQPEVISTTVNATATASGPKSVPARPTGRGRKTTQRIDVEEEEGEGIDDFEMNDAEEPTLAPVPKTRARPKAASAKPTPKAPVKKAPARGRGKKTQVFEQSDEEEEQDILMNEGDHDQPLGPAKRSTATKVAATRSRPARAAAVASSQKGRQTKLNFSSQRGSQPQQPMEISDDAISDDPFESMPSTRSRRR